MWVLLASSPVAMLLAFFIGMKVGKRRTIALFHELQDDGELIVLTRAQHDAAEMGDIKAAIYSERDASDELGAPGDDVPPLGRVPRQSKRGKKKWAADIESGDEA